MRPVSVAYLALPLSIALLISCDRDGEQRPELSVEELTNDNLMAECVANISERFLKRERKLNESAVDALIAGNFETAAQIELSERRLEEARCMALAKCAEEGPSYNAVYYWRCLAGSECEE